MHERDANTKQQRAFKKRWTLRSIRRTGIDLMLANGNQECNGFFVPV